MIDRRVELSARSEPKRPSEAWFAAVVVLAYLPLAVFAIAHHEMWRDELHCWLVARDSATPWAVVHNRAYDGQPPLWYLLLWVLEKTTHDVRSMRIVHVALATGAVWVFARHAPFPRTLRVLFPLGYFLAYEYVAISRCYGLALLLGLAVCVRHPRRLERPAATAALLAALALTTTVATMVAVAYAIGLFVEWTAAASPARHRAWVPIAAAALGTLLAGWCAWPPADSTVTHIRWPRELPSDDAPTRLIVALVPIPKVDFFFWNSNILLDCAPFRKVALLVAVGLAAWLTGVLWGDRLAAVFFGVGAALLVALFAFVYGGDVRHHGFLYVLFLMAAWLARAPRDHRAPTGQRPLRDKLLVRTLGTVLVAQVPGAVIALAYDYRYVFSSGKRAADVLRARGLDRAPLVAEVDFPATAVLGQLPGKPMAYSPRTGEPFSFVKWTARRHWEPTDEQTLAYAAALGASRGEDAVLLFNRPLLPRLIDRQRVTPIAELYDSMIEEENFYIYRVRRGAPSRSIEQPSIGPAP